MFIWISYFAFASYILGTQVGKGVDFSVLADEDHENYAHIKKTLGSIGNDYFTLKNFIVYIVTTWRISIGDISTPDYSKWLIINETQTNPTIRGGINFIIFTIWAHWWFTQFLIFVILLNFLIAIVSQAFDEVVDLDKITYYEQRADLNSEYR